MKNLLNINSKLKSVLDAREASFGSFSVNMSLLSFFKEKIDFGFDGELADKTKEQEMLDAGSFIKNILALKLTRFCFAYKFNQVEAYKDSLKDFLNYSMLYLQYRLELGYENVSLLFLSGVFNFAKKTNYALDLVDFKELANNIDFDNIKVDEIIDLDYIIEALEKRGVSI